MALVSGFVMVIYCFSVAEVLVFYCFSIAEVCCNCKVVLISAWLSENKASRSDIVNVLTKCNAWYETIE